MHPLLQALMNETMQVGTSNHEQQPAGGGLGTTLAKEFFGVATAPTQDQTLLGAVTKSLAKESGLTRADVAAEFTVNLPPASPGTSSEVATIWGNASHQALIELFGAGISGTFSDLSHSLTQPSPVVEDQPNQLWETTKNVGKWVGEKTKTGWQSMQTARAQKIAATKAAQAKAEADTETARKHAEAVRMQDEQTAARQRAADAEKAYADARQQTAKAEVVSVAAATQAKNIWDSFFGGGTSTNASQQDNVVDGEAKDI